MGKALDIAGRRFTRLEAVRYVESRKKVRFWLCRCDCGAETVVPARSLVAGETKSCGCLKRDRSREWAPTLHALNVKTGFSRHPTYQTWRAMKRRCSDPSHRDWHLYGGNGIAVCDRWQKFENFFADMGVRPDGYTLDRIDGAKGYGPDNCRWATPSQQQNNMRSNVRITHAGRTHTLAEWGRLLNIHPMTINSRLRSGWSVAQALDRYNHKSKERVLLTRS